MATWVRVSLRWVGDSPTEADLLAINECLREWDYDTPKLTADGWDEQRWRSPFRGMLEAVPAVLAKIGFPVEMHEGQCGVFYDYPDPPLCSVKSVTQEELEAMPEYYEFMANWVRHKKYREKHSEETVAR